MVLSTVIGLLGVLTLLYLFLKWHYTYWSRRGVPQLDPIPFLGDFKPVLTGQISQQEYFKGIYFKAKANGWKQVGIYTLFSPEWMIVDLDIIKRMYVKDFEYFPDHGFYHHPSEPLSEHLFNLEGEQWKKLRAKLTPTFTTAVVAKDINVLGLLMALLLDEKDDVLQRVYSTRINLNQLKNIKKEHLFFINASTGCNTTSAFYGKGKMKMMFETLLQKGEGLTKMINNYAESEQEFHVKETFARFTTDIIASAAFGIESNCMEDPKHKFREIGRLVFKPSLKKAMLEQFISPSILSKLGYRSFSDLTTSYFTSVVSETIKYRESNNVERKDFMQLMLQLKKQGVSGSAVTDQEIINQAFVFYIAGFETSSTATTFALLELSKHQDIQDKLRQNINDVLEKHGGKLTYDAIVEMDYLDKVICEALRKYPPLAIIPRKCAKDYKVPGSDVIIKKGTMTYIPAWGVQMDPEFFPNPEEFNPENFSPENKATRPDIAYMPFGEGPRQCIGLRFGILQTKVALVCVLKDHRFTFHEKTKWPCEMDKFVIVLSAKGDIWLKVKKLT